MDSRGIGTRERGRRIANYLSKYLSKDVGEDHATGAHRYERSQGFNVRVVKRTGLTYADAMRFVERFYGAPGLKIWDSEDFEDYFGPPCLGMVWP